MIAFTKKELEGFRKDGRKVLKLVRMKENPAYHWYLYRNWVRQGLQYAVVLFCAALPPLEMKNRLYRLIGAKIGRKVSIANDVVIDPIFPELIRIDDNAIIGWGTKLYTHEFTQTTARFGTIHLKENSMVGEWSVVRPGITVGKNSLVAAMSFVNEDVPDNLVEGGVPIHVIRHVKRAAKKR